MAFSSLWITTAFRGRRATKNQTKFAFVVVLTGLERVDSRFIEAQLHGGFLAGFGRRNTGSDHTLCF